MRPSRCTGSTATRPSTTRRSAPSSGDLLGEFTDRRFAVRPSNVKAVTVRSFPTGPRVGIAARGGEPTFFWRADGEIGKPAAAGDPAASPPASAGVVGDGAALAAELQRLVDALPLPLPAQLALDLGLRVGRALPRARRLLRDRLPSGHAVVRIARVRPRRRQGRHRPRPRPARGARTGLPPRPWTAHRGGTQARREPGAGRGRGRERVERARRRRVRLRRRGVRPGRAPPGDARSGGGGSRR